MKPCPPHYWIIETPHGKTSMGHCKYCPAVKEFKNSLPARRFTDNTFLSYSNREIYLGKRETLYQTVWG